jgi:hypothetical protein
MGGHEAGGGTHWAWDAGGGCAASGDGAGWGWEAAMKECSPDMIVVVGQWEVYGAGSTVQTNERYAGVCLWRSAQTSGGSESAKALATGIVGRWAMDVKPLFGSLFDHRMRR